MRHDEQRLQQTVAEYLAWALAPPSIWTAHPLGGGGELRGKIIKSTGARAGWPDIEIIANDGRFYAIELKSRTGAVRTIQRTTMHAIQVAGGSVAVCRSLDEVRAQLVAWGIPTRETKPVAPIIRALAADLASG